MLPKLGKSSPTRTAITKVCAIREREQTIAAQRAASPLRAICQTALGKMDVEDAGLPDAASENPGVDRTAVE
jgi:hypothetical protein